jgi:hypothetical protein
LLTSISIEFKDHRESSGVDNEVFDRMPAISKRGCVERKPYM